MAVGAGLGYLWRILDEYEYSLPDQVLSVYLAPAVEGWLPLLFTKEAATPGLFETPADKAGFIRELLSKDQLVYQRSKGKFGDGREIYLFKSGGETLATMTLQKILSGRFGHWEAANVELHLPIYGDLRVIAPTDALVRINGASPPESSVAEEGLPYPALSNLPPEIGAWPTQREYRISGLYKKPEVLAEGFDGNLLEVKWHEENGENWAAVSPTGAPPEEEKVREMALADAKLYSMYTSRDTTFAALSKRLLRQSHIYASLRNMETIFYTDHTRVAFADGQTSNFRKFSPSCMAIDVDYVYCVYRDKREYRFPTASTFIYWKTGKGWLIADIILR
ncbi:MAG: hypothetical protein LBT23_10110 [Synergistaceae bacterium]|nr:hypothetical protein [Synergistaceae bacterium]